MNLDEVWDIGVTQGFTKPRIFEAFCPGRNLSLYTAIDQGPIWFFVARDPGKERLYALPGELDGQGSGKWEIVSHSGKQLYRLDNNSLQVISCTKPDFIPVQQFVYTNIIYGGREVPKVTRGRKKI